VQKVIEPEPLIGWRQVNTHWKYFDVIYPFSIQLSVRFQKEQHHILIFLTAACSQDRSDIVIGFCLFGGDAVGLSIAIRHGASKSFAATRNLATDHRILSVMAFCCDYIFEKFLNQIALMADFFSFECWERLAQKHGWFTVWSSRPDVVSGIVHSCSIH
jgi:hypothetical protein